MGLPISIIVILGIHPLVPPHTGPAGKSWPRGSCEHELWNTGGCPSQVGKREKLFSPRCSSSVDWCHQGLKFCCVSCVPTPGALTCWARRFIFSQNVPYNNSRRRFFQIFDKIFLRIIKNFYVSISYTFAIVLSQFSLVKFPLVRWVKRPYCSMA